MSSVWAIGDIHGEIDKLVALLSALPRGPADETVFLGDYIDRGPDTAAVVRRLLAEIDAAPERTVLLWGNHEDMAAAHFGYGAPSGFRYDPYDWFQNGGHATMESFGFPLPSCYVASCPPELDALFPRLRLFFRSALPGLEPYLFVHAGILPGQEPETAPAETLLWVRQDFLEADQPPGRIVVHGHTPMKRPRILPDKMGIDTGAAYGGPLTALQLPERQIYRTDPAAGIVRFDL